MKEGICLSKTLNFRSFSPNSLLCSDILVIFASDEINKENI